MGERFEKIRTRALTILIGIPGVLFVIYQDGILFSLTVIALAILGSLELRNMFKNKNISSSLFLGLAITLFFLLQKNALEVSSINKAFLFTFLLLLLFLKNFLLKNKQSMTINISIALFIGIYIGHFLSFLIQIREMEYGKLLLVFVLFTTWMSDTAAYIVGVRLGKNHIFPIISPNKTLEGSLGGILVAAIFATLFCFLLPIEPMVLFFLGIITAISGQVGDLFESSIKRDCMVKDSGHLLPGHGGILDCMDSILFSVPVLYFCFYFLDNIIF